MTPDNATPPLTSYEIGMAAAQAVRDAGGTENEAGRAYYAAQPKPVISAGVQRTHDAADIRRINKQRKADGLPQIRRRTAK